MAASLSRPSPGWSGPPPRWNRRPAPSAPSMSMPGPSARSRFYDLIRLVEGTEVNSFVIDVKDDTGYLTYRSTVPHRDQHRCQHPAPRPGRPGPAPGPPGPRAFTPSPGSWWPRTRCWPGSGPAGPFTTSTAGPGWTARAVPGSTPTPIPSGPTPRRSVPRRSGWDSTSCSSTTCDFPTSRGPGWPRPSFRGSAARRTRSRE